MFGKLLKKIGRHKNSIFLILLIVLGLKVFVPQLDDFYDSIKALNDANMNWIMAGLLVYFAGITTFAFQIVVLAFKPLSYGLTYKVEMAGQFVSKLLPSFVGVFSLNMYYLIKKGHSATQATSVMAANAVASTVAYTILIIAALTQSSVPTSNLKGSISIPDNLIYFIIILALGLCYMLYRSTSFRKRLGKMWSDIKINLKTYKNEPFALIVSIICNGLGSAANIFALYASAHAIGVDISFASALIGYTFGNVAMTLVPTPGGLGSAEAGIYAGLVFAGVDGPQAMTITLLYRLISYWLPIIPGYFFFWDLRKNVLSDFSFKKRYDSA